MVVFRPIVFDDPRFPDARGLLLAWSIETKRSRGESERGLFLFTSRQRFFLCGSVPERAGLIGFLEIEHDLSQRQYYRMEKHLLPFPDALLDSVLGISADRPFRSRSPYNSWRA